MDNLLPLAQQGPFRIAGIWRQTSFHFISNRTIWREAKSYIDLWPGRGPIRYHIVRSHFCDRVPLNRQGPFTLEGFAACPQLPLSSRLLYVHFGCEEEWIGGRPAYFWGWYCGSAPWIHYSRNISTQHV